jgi:transcriptional regulator with XRE-family HTH domain
MASLGQGLRRERELRGISLREIANQTKINIRFLEALENDQLDILPGTFFIKAIIREYAKSIGLEEHAALNKYYETSLIQEKEQENEEKKGKSFSWFSNNRTKVFSYAILFVFLLLVPFSYIFFFRKGEKSSPPTKPKIENVTQKPKPKPPEPEIESEPVKEEKEIALEISFIERTWIQVYADGELMVDGIKLPGEVVKIIASEELVLNLGNAGGISYTLNSQKGKNLGPSGAVRTNKRITFENLQEYIEQEGEESIRDV